MTLIAGYKFKGGAFLQSDILLTSESRCSHPEIKVPTYSGTNNIPFTDNRIAGLVQKIFIIKEKFAVSCAGDLSVIKGAIHCIKAFMLHRMKISSEEIIHHLYREIGDEINQISLIFININNHLMEMGFINSEKISINENIDLYVAGSGNSRAKESFSKFPPDFFDVPHDDVVAHGVCTSLSQFAEYILKEFDNKQYSENFQDYFGGGFEVAAFFDGKIQKISNILYSYSEAYLDEESYIQIEPPSFILKSQYVDNYLLIRSAEVYLDKKHHKINNDRICIIPPLDANEGTRSNDNIDMVNFAEAEFVCYFVRFKFGDNNYIIFPFIKKYSSSVEFIKSGFTFLNVDGYLFTNFSEKFRGEISERIMYLMNSKKK